MWIPKEKWNGEKILDWVDLSPTDIWVSIPDKTEKGETLCGTNQHTQNLELCLHSTQPKALR